VYETFAIKRYFNIRDQSKQVRTQKNNIMRQPHNIIKIQCSGLDDDSPFKINLPVGYAQDILFFHPAIIFCPAA
jgi:hypothetical protein